MAVSRQDRWILATLWLLVFSLSSQLLILAPILPLIGERLDVPAERLGILLTAYAATVGGFTLLSGAISDRIGRRRILLVGSGALSLVLALHGLAQGFVSLLVLRGLAGAAGGVLGGAGTAYISDYFPAHRRGWANGWMMSGVATGQIAGIPLGTLLADRFSVQAPFLVFAVSSFLSFVMIWRWLPQPAVETTGEPLTLERTLAGYRALLRRSPPAVATFATCLVLAASGLFATYLPVWLEAHRGFESDSIAALYLLGGVAHVVAGPMAGRFSDRAGRRKVVLAASLGITVLLLPWPWIHGAAIPVLFFLLFAALASRLAVFQAYLSELVTAGERGKFLSLTLASGQLGLAIGSAAAGWLYIGYGLQSNAWVAAALVLTTAALIWRFLPATGPEPDVVSS